MAVFCLAYYSVLIAATKNPFGEPRQVINKYVGVEVVGFLFALLSLAFVITISIVFDLIFH